MHNKYIYLLDKNILWDFCTSYENRTDPVPYFFNFKIHTQTYFFDLLPPHTSTHIY